MTNDNIKRARRQTNEKGLTWPELTGCDPRAAMRGSPRGIGLHVACWAASQGYYTLAMVPLALTGGEKRPYEWWSEKKHGHDAVAAFYRTSEDLRKSRYFPRRRCGVSILTEKCGLVVIDLDSANGEAWLRDLADGREIKTRILKTHKGRHLIFQDGGVRYKTQNGEIIPGVDVRGAGGIELIYDPGQPDRHFTDLTEPAELPDWLAEVLPPEGSRSRRARAGANGHRNDLDVRRIIKQGIPPGQHDSTMTSLAMSQARKGVFAQDGSEEQEWLAFAYGILNRAGEGQDADGNVRENFSDDKIIGWYTSACAVIAAEGAALDSYPWNDAGNALRLHDLHGDDMLFVPELNRWLVWDGRVWADDQGAANGHAVSVCLYLSDQASKIQDEDASAAMSRFATSTGNHNKLQAMLKQAAALPEMGMNLRAFDADPRVLPVRNGTLILNDGVEFVHEHRKEDYCRSYVPVDYDPDADSEQWQGFLDMFVPDLAVRQYLQRLAGYTLLGANPERKLIFLIGPSSTGKTTFLKLLTAVLGSGTAGPFSLSLFRDKGHDAPRPDMLVALGRRFIHTTEASTEWKLHADTIKHITGGDQLTARGMFSNKFTERVATFTPWIATNAYPRIEHADPALWRRLVAVRFDNVVPDADDNPEFTLDFPAAQRAGILRWAVDGYRTYCVKGLGDAPAAVTKATEQLRIALSAIDRWIADRCEIGESLKCPAADLFYNYQGWCDEEDISERARFTQTAFGRMLSDRGFNAPEQPERVGPRHKGKRARMRYGLRISGEKA
jgi:P4 family phage/plasmid primase-like protien